MNRIGLSLTSFKRPFSPFCDIKFSVEGKTRDCYSVLELKHRSQLCLLWMMKINKKQIKAFAHEPKVMIGICHVDNIWTSSKELIKFTVQKQTNWATWQQACLGTSAVLGFDFDLPHLTRLAPEIRHTGKINLHAWHFSFRLPFSITCA